MSCKGQCEVIINDLDLEIVARNVILLLIPFHFEPNDAAPIMLHVWYSVFIPAQMLQVLQDRILPLFQEVCKKIREKPSTSLQSKMWTFGKSSLPAWCCRDRHGTFYRRTFKYPRTCPKLKPRKLWWQQRWHQRGSILHIENFTASHCTGGAVLWGSGKPGNFCLLAFLKKSSILLIRKCRKCWFIC